MGEVEPRVVELQTGLELPEQHVGHLVGTVPVPTLRQRRQIPLQLAAADRFGGSLAGPPPAASRVQ